jgi:hypothetical protein
MSNVSRSPVFAGERFLPSKSAFAKFATAIMILVGTSAGAAFAAPNWSLTLSDNSLSGNPGSLLVFSGTIANTSADALLVDTLALILSPSIDPGSYTADYADDFLGTLGIIPVGGYTGPLFYVHWSPSVAPGTVLTGNFELAMIPPGDPQVLSVPFTASVDGSGGPVVPEPQVLYLVMGGLMCLPLLRRRKDDAR